MLSCPLHEYRSQIPLVHPVSFSPYQHFLPKKSGLNSTEKHQIYLFFRSRTLGDEIFYGVIGEEFLKFSVELRRQSLVVGDDQSRFIQLLDDIRHRKNLAQSSDDQKGLALFAFLEAFEQVSTGLRLVAGGGVF